MHVHNIEVSYNIIHRNSFITKLKKKREEHATVERFEQLRYLQGKQT